MYTLGPNVILIEEYTAPILSQSAESYPIENNAIRLDFHNGYRIDFFSVPIQR